MGHSYGDLLRYASLRKTKHKETNRYRAERIQAISEQKCYQVALECGLLEPYEIIEIPPREPTEGQLEYAKKLNLNIPQGAFLNDVSTLIDRAVNGDSSEPNTELIEYANAREMIFSKYIGKKALYDVVFDTLTGKDKIAFFLFCVYRWLSDDRFGNLDKHKNKDKFYSLAETLIVDSSFVKSMNRYKGREIRFFGELKYKESNSYHGGSTNTDAFKNRGGNTHVPAARAQRTSRSERTAGCR